MTGNNGAPHKTPHGWMSHERWLAMTGRDLISQLQNYRHMNCWEFRNGDIWINASVFSCDQRSAESLRQNPQKPARKTKPTSPPPPEAGLQSIVDACDVVLWAGTKSGLSQRRKGEQYVYLIACEGLLKVGVARWPEKRLVAMQGGNPFPMHIWGLLLPEEMTAFQLESLLHRALCRYAARGEWFSEGAIDLFAALQVDRKITEEASHLRLV